MAIGKVPGSLSGSGAGGLTPCGSGLPRAEAERARGVRQPTSSGQPAVIADIDAGVSMQAPAGVDPALWRVLTAEERQSFGQLGSTGRLAEGPRGANVPLALVRAGRIERTV